MPITNATAAEPMIDFLRKLHHSVQTPAQRRIALSEGPSAVPAPRVLVVGAGPAGLPAAIVAHREGALVTVVEQRRRRTRPVWFDLAADEEIAAGSDEITSRTDDSLPPSQAVLREWGFFDLWHPVVPDEGGSGVVTVQCLVLERFLELAARLLGITIHLDVAFDAPCIDDSGDFAAALVRPSAERPGERGGKRRGALPLGIAEPLPVAACARSAAVGGVDALPQPQFDLLIGADGPHSAVRSALAVGYNPRAAFTAGGILHRSLPELSQVTLIVSFALDETGYCPQVQDEPCAGASARMHWAERVGRSQRMRLVIRSICGRRAC